jgi:O-antigen ligase
MAQALLLAWSQPLASGLGGWVHWAGRVVPVANVFLASGRIGFIAVISGMFAWYADSRRRCVMGLAAMTVAVVLAGAWLTMFRPSAIENLLKFEDGRIVHWHVAGVIIHESPWFGTGGKAGFKRESNRIVSDLYAHDPSKQYMDTPDAHNSFLGIASQFGLPALVLYLGFLCSVLRYLWLRRQICPIAWRLGVGLVVSATAAGQFEHLAGHTVTGYALFLPLGFAVALAIGDSKDVTDEIKRDAKLQ